MAHEGLWEQLDKLDSKLTAERAKCDYLSDQGRYVLKLLNKEYVVEVGTREIFSAETESEQSPAGFLEQLCLLAYLINAQNLSAANKLVRPEALPSGQFFFRGLHSLPTEKLERGDDEFGARASVLFDQTAASHLPLDALLAAGNLAVDAVIEACGQSS
jgi:hypothetical protein